MATRTRIYACLLWTIFFSPTISMAGDLESTATCKIRSITERDLPDEIKKGMTELKIDRLIECRGAFSGLQYYWTSSVRKNVGGDVCLFDARLTDIKKGKGIIAAWPPENFIVWMNSSSHDACPKANTVDYVRTGGVSSGTFSLFIKEFKSKFSSIDNLDKEIRALPQEDADHENIDKLLSAIKSNKKVSLLSFGSDYDIGGDDPVTKLNLFEPNYNFMIQVEESRWLFTFDFCPERGICLLSIVN